MLDLPQQLALDLVFGHRRTPFRFACLLVDVLLRFLHQMIVHGQRDVIDMVQSRYEVDAFDTPSLRVVI